MTGSGNPRRKSVALLWSCVALLLAGCATSNEIHLVLKVQELERRNKALQIELLQSELETLQYRRGQAIQSEMLAECWALI